MLQIGREEDRGAIVGLANSVGSVSRMLAPTAVGVCQEYGVRVPGYFSAVLALGAAGVALFCCWNLKCTNESPSAVIDRTYYQLFIPTFSLHSHVILHNNYASLLVFTFSSTLMNNNLVQLRSDARTQLPGFDYVWRQTTARMPTYNVNGPSSHAHRGRGQSAVKWSSSS